MTKLLNVIRADRRGVTALEYGLIAAFIAVALVAVLPTLTASLTTTFTSIATSLGSAQPATK